MSQTILYARVSTVDQTVAHQRKQAEAAGFEIDDMVMDEGVSGISTRLVDRPQGRRLFDMLRRGDILVVRWVDRLGRNYQNVTDTVREFMRRGVIIKTVINTLTFDGATQTRSPISRRSSLAPHPSNLPRLQARCRMTRGRPILGPRRRL